MSLLFMLIVLLTVPLRRGASWIFASCGDWVKVFLDTWRALQKYVLNEKQNKKKDTVFFKPCFVHNTLNQQKLITYFNPLLYFSNTKHCE